MLLPSTNKPWCVTELRSSMEVLLTLGRGVAVGKPTWDSPQVNLRYLTGATNNFAVDIENMTPYCSAESRDLQ